MNGKFWEVVGKAGAALALITGAIQLYKYANPDGPNLVSTCTITEVPLPVFSQSYVDFLEGQNIVYQEYVMFSDKVKTFFAYPTDNGATRLKEQIEE